MELEGAGLLKQRNPQGGGGPVSVRHRCSAALLRFFRMGIVAWPSITHVQLPWGPASLLH